MIDLVGDAVELVRSVRAASAVAPPTAMVQRAAVSDLQLRHVFGGPALDDELDASGSPKYGPAGWR